MIHLLSPITGGLSNLFVLLHFRETRPACAILATASWWWLITVYIVTGVYAAFTGIILIPMGILGLLSSAPLLHLFLAFSPFFLLFLLQIGNILAACLWHNGLELQTPNSAAKGVYQLV